MLASTNLNYNDVLHFTIKSFKSPIFDLNICNNVFSNLSFDFMSKLLMSSSINIPSFNNPYFDSCKRVKVNTIPSLFVMFYT